MRITSPQSGKCYVASVRRVRTFIIAGFGRVGQVIGRLLDERGYRWVAVDLDAKNVERSRKERLPVFSATLRRRRRWPPRNLTAQSQYSDVAFWAGSGTSAFGMMGLESRPFHPG
ncbi:NAD-binding protein [Mesorhizobium sp.]|uniref:NAD-binding protein n=1 Tax=Mesorhizobium sp. TaxID=1871066 RepID=UPI000FE87323|nr:MAG: hypothetical protein EOR09_21910 [Mesorhizobium sp.]